MGNQRHRKVRLQFAAGCTADYTTGCITGWTKRYFSKYLTTKYLTYKMPPEIRNTSSILDKTDTRV